ncbi:CHASE2 domain-containing protein [Aurantimonas marianensis]|uniref:Adenylate/guanylate cyclase domain-containing protein n=1 Tax=Aurantimonas marianensis TaxID=2920428 RepID=A0A9X2HED9_9HYPH|nr:adenylate/guanylate cyclase domain-containing protein [Aurantimonas marianensis]
MITARLARLPLSAVAAATLLAGIWAGWLGVTHLAAERSFVDRIEEPLADIRLLIAGPRPPPAAVIIVAIDDETVAAENGYPLARDRIAEVVRGIAAAGAQALAVDILFIAPSTAFADRALADALAAVPSVIAAAGQFDRTREQAIAAPATADELWPLAPLTRVASVGLVNVSTDAGGTPRHLPLVVGTTRGPVPGFALAATALYHGTEPVLGSASVTVAGSRIPLDAGWHLPLRVHGSAKTIATVSALDFLSTSGARPPSLSGRIAVLGVTATAVGDTFGTPFDPVTPGVEIQATGIAQLLGGAGLVRDDRVRRADATLAVLLALGGTLLVALVPLTYALPVVAFVLFLILGATAVLFGHGIWMSAALPLAASMPPIALTAFARQMHERRQAGLMLRTEEALRRFQPAALAERIADDPTFLNAPLEQMAAVLFVDLAGFTSQSERLGPALTHAFLKQFHTLVVDDINAHQGVVMNFMGDGAMIVFGVADDTADPAGRAFAAGFALANDVSAWLERQGAGGGGPGIRLGLHFGTVSLSRLGHEIHQQISVSGDTVNVASRLMEVAKSAGATIAASMDLIEAMDGTIDDAGEPDEVRMVDIRGRRQSVNVALWRQANLDARHR